MPLPRLDRRKSMKKSQDHFVPMSSSGSRVIISTGEDGSAGRTDSPDSILNFCVGWRLRTLGTMNGSSQHVMTTRAREVPMGV